MIFNKAFVYLRKFRVCIKIHKTLQVHLFFSYSSLGVGVKLQCVKLCTQTNCFLMMNIYISLEYCVWITVPGCDMLSLFFHFKNDYYSNCATANKA